MFTEDTTGRKDARYTAYVMESQANYDAAFQCAKDREVSYQADRSRAVQSGLGMMALGAGLMTASPPAVSSAPPPPPTHYTTTPLPGGGFITRAW